MTAYIGGRSPHYQIGMSGSNQASPSRPTSRRSDMHSTSGVWSLSTPYTTLPLPSCFHPALRISLSTSHSIYLLHSDSERSDSHSPCTDECWSRGSLDAPPCHSTHRMASVSCLPTLSRIPVGLHASFSAASWKISEGSAFLLPRLRRFANPSPPGHTHGVGMYIVSHNGSVEPI